MACPECDTLRHQISEKTHYIDVWEARSREVNHEWATVWKQVDACERRYGEAERAYYNDRDDRAKEYEFGAAANELEAAKQAAAAVGTRMGEAKETLDGLVWARQNLQDKLHYHTCPHP